MPEEFFLKYLPFLIAGGLLIGFFGIAASIYTTRLRIKNGYPLEGTWGQKHYPKTDQESVERHDRQDPDRRDRDGEQGDEGNDKARPQRPTVR